MLLHAGSTLVGMYLVLHRPNRCRQWGELELCTRGASHSKRAAGEKLIWIFPAIKSSLLSRLFQVQYSWLWKLANVTQSPYSYVWSNDTRSPELVNGPPRRTMYVTALYFTMTCMTSVSRFWLCWNEKRKSESQIRSVGFSIDTSSSRTKSHPFEP
jgi:hypothetical protein